MSWQNNNNNTCGRQNCGGCVNPAPAPAPVSCSNCLVPVDCGDELCFPCLSCSYPDVYADVICCTQKAFIISNSKCERDSNCNPCSIAYATLPCDKTSECLPFSNFANLDSCCNQDLLKAFIKRRDQLMAFLEKVCNCFSDNDWCKKNNNGKYRDNSEKDKIIRAMAKIICCYFDVAASCPAILFCFQSQAPTPCTPGVF